MKKILTVFLILGLVGACVGTTQPSRFYSFKAVENVDPISKARLNIGVADVKIPNYLDRPQIVTAQKDAVELNVSELNRWSEPLSSLLQRTIANDMSAYLPNSTIKPVSYSRDNFDYMIYVEVNQMDGAWEDNVILNAWWSGVNRDGKTILKGKANLSGKLGKGYEDYVLQQSTLIGALSQQIVQEIARHKK